MVGTPGKLRVLDPWFDPINKIEELYGSGEIKRVADRYEELLTNHIATPYALAVNGTWGGGKSTFLRYLQEGLKQSGHPVLRFNPWEYEREGDVVLALEKKMAEEFRRIPGETLKTMGVFGLAFLGVAVNTLSKLAGMTEYDKFSQILDDADAAINNKEYVKYEDTVRRTQNDFRRLTKRIKDETERPLIIFLDDLDRCLPDNALKLLEALKNLFVVEGAEAIFVCGIDTDVAKRFIEQRYPGISPDFSINYFKKIFNHTLELPHVFPADLRQCLISYACDLFAGDLDDYGTASAIEKTVDLVVELSDLAGNRSLRSIFNVINEYYVIRFITRTVIGDDRIFPVLVFKERWHGLYERALTEIKKSNSDQAELRGVLSSPVLQEDLEPSAVVFLGKVNLSITVAELNELNLV